MAHRKMPKFDSGRPGQTPMRAAKAKEEEGDRTAPRRPGAIMEEGGATATSSSKKREAAPGSTHGSAPGYIARHWLGLVNIALGIFVGLPWLAPVFAALGWWGLANPIYSAYAVT